MRANFAKSRREQGQFENLYKLFFHELRQDERVARSEPLENQFQDAIGSLGDQAAESTASQAVMDFLGGDPSSLLEQIQGMASGSQDGGGGGMGANLEAVTRRLEFMLALNAAETQLELYLDGQRENLTWEQRQDLLSHIKDRLNTARRLQKRGPKPRTDLLMIVRVTQEER